MIPPGGEGQIKVTLRPKGRVTKISKRIIVHSDDPEQPRFALTIKGELLVDVLVEPSSVMIRDLEAGEAGSGRFELVRGQGSTAKIASLTLEDQANFSLREVPDDELGGQDLTAATIDGGVGGSEGSLGTYEVEFHGSQEVGTVATVVKVVTTSADTPELRVRVHANVAKNLRYLKTLRFTRRDGALQDRQIHISARHGDAPTITGVKDVDGLLDYEVQPASGALVSISVAVREDQWAALDLEGRAALHELIVSTDDEEEPEIVFHYRVAPKTKAKTKTKTKGSATEVHLNPSALPAG